MRRKTIGKKKETESLGRASQTTDGSSYERSEDVGASPSERRSFVGVDYSEETRSTSNLSKTGNVPVGPYQDPIEFTVEQQKVIVDQLITKESSDLQMRERAVYLMLAIFSLTVLSTLLMLNFEGFGAWGFDLPDPFLHWLGVATVGEVAGLLVITFRYLFPSNTRDVEGANIK